MDKEINSNERDEFIYTKLFNNLKITMHIKFDLTIGSVDEWVDTCNKFNNGGMILRFAFIYIFDGMLYCDNMHPFSEKTSNDYETLLLSLSNL